MSVPSSELGHPARPLPRKRACLPPRTRRSNTRKSSADAAAVDEAAAAEAAVVEDEAALPVTITEASLPCA